MANDGDEFLANTDADAQGGENFYGQNQSLAGDGGWWDDNYPGQTVQNPNAVTENVFDPRQEPVAQIRGTADRLADGAQAAQCEGPNSGAVC